jgi:hypothetical protein
MPLINISRFVTEIILFITIKLFFPSSALQKAYKSIAFAGKNDIWGREKMLNEISRMLTNVMRGVARLPDLRGKF